MKFLPNLIITCFLVAMSFNLVNLYEGTVSGLFGQVADSLGQIRSVI